MAKFIGRKEELECLKLLSKKKVASLTVIRGRRRIGKSRLIDEFGKTMPNYYLFTGNPPTPKTTKQSQLDAFCDQLAAQFSLPDVTARGWREALMLLSQFVEGKKVVVALDEISWMGSKDHEFLGHLKTAWDLGFSKNDKLILIVCGSVSSWIEKNILRHTGFLGRISTDLLLEELSLNEAAEFWGDRKKRVSPMEILKTLSVTGGIPRYLEEVHPALSAEENICKMCFQKRGLLFREFDQIFSDLFSQQAPSYIEVVDYLSMGSHSLTEVALALKKPESTSLLYLQNLVQAGFVAEDPDWNIKTMKPAKSKRYRLSDNYVRFYLRYIRPEKTSIRQKVGSSFRLQGLPQWSTIVGLQFENLVTRNAHLIIQSLNLEASEVTMYGPYIQRPTQRQKGCQIDLLIQTRYRAVYLCEVKFSSESIGLNLLQGLLEKQDRLKLPRGWSKRLVLIHANGVTDDLYQADQIDHFIDFSSFIK